jgi:hypothetical protein
MAASGAFCDDFLRKWRKTSSNEGRLKKIGRSNGLLFAKRAQLGVGVSSPFSAGC